MGLRVLIEGIGHQIRDSESLGDTLALMWRRDALSPSKKDAPLRLECLLRQSQAQNLLLTDTSGRVVSANLIEGRYRTRSISVDDGNRKLLETQWDGNGTVVSSAALNLQVPDYTQRPWYRLGLASNGSSWTSPYRFISPQVLGVTYCRKVVDPQGKTLGVVGVDLVLAELDKQVQRYRPTPHSLAYLIDTNGNRMDGAEQAANAITQAALGSRESLASWPMVSAYGQRWLVHRAQMEGPGWQVVLAIPVRDLIGRPLRITFTALGLGIIAFLFIAFRLAVISKRISRPLSELADTSVALMLGHPMPQPATEITELAQARSALELAAKSAAEQRQMETELQRIQRLELVGAMAAGLAHDMRNHLTAIQGQIDLALLKAPSGPQAKHLESAMEACGGMSSILKDLISFGKPKERIIEQVSLNALVVKAAGLLEFSGGRLLNVALDLDPSSPRVTGNPVQLEQVILNLGFNAKDATRAGGTVSVRTGTRAEEAFVEVRDSGTGMSPEVKARLFTPFFSTKDEKGTGLGLAMVANIAKSHKGRIEVESDPGVGSVFTVWLPLAEGS